MKKKLRVIISAILVILYVYILGSGFFVGAFAIRGEKGEQYILLYAILSISFPTLICIMYHHIEKLKEEVNFLKKELEMYQKNP